MMRRSLFVMMGIATLATPVMSNSVQAQDRPAKNRDTAAMLQQTAPIAPSTVTTAPLTRGPAAQTGNVSSRGDSTDGWARPDFSSRRTPGTVVPRDPDAPMGSRSSGFESTTTTPVAGAARMPSPSHERAPSTAPVPAATSEGGEESEEPDGASSADLEEQEIEEQEGAFSFSGGATLATDYVSRGYTQTDGSPAVQGYVGVEHESGLYGEIWASTIDFNDGESEAEVDFLASYSYEFGDVTAEAGAIYYWYPGVDSDWDYDYTELFFAFYADMFDEMLSLAWTGYYSPDFFGGSGDAQYAVWEATMPMSWYDVDLFDLHGSVGYQWIDDNVTYGAPDYFDWSVGLSRTMWEYLTASVTYYGTDVDDVDCDNLCEDRIVAALAVDL